jgi:hypothetical protein
MSNNGGGITKRRNGGGSSHESNSYPQPPPGYSTGAGFSMVCGVCECYNINKELLDYDYSNPQDSKILKPSSIPRHYERGEYYIDTYNDQPWSWTFGTHELVRDSNSAVQVGR